MTSSTSASVASSGSTLHAHQQQKNLNREHRVIGVLAIQGAYAEHARMLKECQAKFGPFEVRYVKTVEDLQKLETHSREELHRNSNKRPRADDLGDESGHDEDQIEGEGSTQSSPRRAKVAKKTEENTTTKEQKSRKKCWIDGLIIPGGESTTMKIMMQTMRSDILEFLKTQPTWGTCAMNQNESSNMIFIL